MLSSPITGNDNLDSFLYDITTYITGVEPTTVYQNGAIIAPSGDITGYLNRFIHVKYANDNIGTGLSDVQTGKAYYGIFNSSLSTESTNPTDYTWYLVSGGFGSTKYLYYNTIGGRSIQWFVGTTLPDYTWAVAPSTSIDLDIVSSTSISSIPSFQANFSPSTYSIPYSGSAYTFTGITPTLYGTNNGINITFSAAQTDAAQATNTWRIGNSSTTGYADITKNNITVGDPSLSGIGALWPAPTAVSSLNSSVIVPIRYKDILGNVFQCTNEGISFTVVTDGTNGTNATAAPAIDISGYSSFSQNAGGANTPSSVTLTALTTNITAPTYSWSVTGATPTSGTGVSITISPNTSTTLVTVTLTVNGTSLGSALVRSWNMPVVYSGAAGSAGANGVMAVYPSIYIWTASSTPPTRPATTSTYTWATGAYTPPSGWSTTAPSDTTPGHYLWQITIPVSTVATTTTSLLDWTNTSYAINAIAYNGANGSNGTNGTNGTNGLNGTRTAVMDLYKWSATVPVTFPSGSSTYTWATAQFTNPATLNGWSATPGSAVVGQTLYIARQVFADTGSSATSSISWTTSSAIVISAAGTNGSNGSNGTRTAVLEVYQWAASTPATFPSGSSTYTWATGVFNLPATPNGWSLLPGVAVPGQTLWGTNVVYVDTLTAATSSVTWSAVAAYPVGSAGTNGTNGSNGTNGTNGSDGSASFSISRVANDSSAPTNAEVTAVIGRNPIAGDICTVQYNTAASTNAVGYRYTTAWSLFNTYIAGSLVVQNTITADRMNVTNLGSISADLGTITGGELTISGAGGTPTISGTTMTGQGSHLYSDGRFALGDSTRNIVNNGSQVTLNGFANVTSFEDTVFFPGVSSGTVHQEIVLLTPFNTKTGKISIITTGMLIGGVTGTTTRSFDTLLLLTVYDLTTGLNVAGTGSFVRSSVFTPNISCGVPVSIPFSLTYYSTSLSSLIGRNLEVRLTADVNLLNVSSGIVVNELGSSMRVAHKTQAMDLIL